MITFLLSVLGIVVVGGLAVTRNEWVYRRRVWAIRNDPELYDRLLDYHACFNRFWVWDIRKLTRVTR